MAEKKDNASLVTNDVVFIGMFFCFCRTVFSKLK